MIGAVSYGTYIPVYRLERDKIAKEWGKTSRGGEKAVANYDEDSLTMGVEAAFNCLDGMSEDRIDAVFFASTTPPYREKQSASILASVVGAGEQAFTVDFADSLRAGTTAIIAAMHFINSNPGGRVLVVMSDLRVHAPDSNLELSLGDGAAAFLIGDSEIAVIIEGFHSTSSEFVDIWRRDDERYYRTSEDRFILEEGFLKIMESGISGLMKKYNLKPGDFIKAIFNAPDARRHTEIARRAGIDPKSQLQELLIDSIGNTGNAFAPMMAIAALEEAKVGDRFLLGNYGDGCDVLVLRTTRENNNRKDKRGIKFHLRSKAALPSYGRYLRLRGLFEKEAAPYAPLPSSLPIIWRDRKQIYSLHGCKCQRCGTVQFPIQRICTNCQAKDSYDIIKMPKKGTLFTFSVDERAPVIDPPDIRCVVDLEGGGRFPCSMTDSGIRKTEVGMPVELTFRNLHAGSGVNNYFWKCRPGRT